MLDLVIVVILCIEELGMDLDVCCIINRFLILICIYKSVFCVFVVKDEFDSFLDIVYSYLVYVCCMIFY